MTAVTTQYRLQRWLDHLRHLTGDDAYERYVEHHDQDHLDQPLLNRREFYLAEQQRKWSGVTRCC